MVHQAVEMNASQSTFKEKTLNYLAAFAQNAMDKRIPPGSNPVAGPVNLIALSAANGYLGASQAYNNFKPSTYSVAPVGGALPLATSFWFTDLAIANTWKAFHKSAFDSVFVSPLPLPAVPYCSGQRPSSIDARFYVQPGVVFDPNNFFRFEISDITGNFDHPIYSARWFGTTTSSLLSDSISNAIISDNLSYMRNVPSPVVKRYRIRVVSTKPYFESTNSGETDINFCGPAGGEPRVYLSTVRPYKSTYSPGDSIAVMVYKNPIFPYTPGNNLRIELSNKNYEFTAGLSTVVFSGVPPFTGSTTLDSFLVKIKLPDTLSFGNRYRLKPFIEGVSAVIGRQTSGNGHDITLVPNQTGNVIVINTRPVLNIGQTTAESGGNVLFDGGSAITARGVCWSTSPAPTVALSTKTNDGAGSGTYASNLTGLTSGTLYYVRAYATNGGGTQYGNELSFTTSQPNQVPVLTTDSIISITQTEAISGGNVTFDGNSEVTTRGICWSTNPNPTSDLATKTEDGTGPGTYISNITGLNPSTLYYVRAYAINTTGVGYGNQRSFTTSGQAVQLPSVLSNNVSNISSDSARGGGNVTFDGGGSVTARGICWSTSPLPTVDLPTKTVDGSGNGIFISWMTNLSPATSYFARAYATNAAGTSYGDEVTFTTIVSIRDAIGSADFRYYPNPADQVLFLDSGFPISPENIEVFDAQGRNVQVSVSKNFNQGLRIQTTQLPSGMYKILVRTAKGPIRFSFLR
jgi:RecA/RadA recombinase